MISIRALYGAAFFLSVGVSATMAGFTTETVFSDGEVPSGSSIALDSSNEPHVCFEQWLSCGEWNGETMKYAFRQGSMWTVEPILSGDCPLLGFGGSLVLDANDHPHAAINAFLIGEIVHATRVDGSWVLETVDSGGNYSGDLSLAMDANGDLHLSYSDSGTGALALKYAFRSGPSWSTETVDATNQSGNYNSLALDPDGQPCITYNAYQGNWLRFARKVDGAWVTENIESSVNLFGCTSLVVDAAGTPHVAYARPSGSVAYAVRTEGGWLIETVPSVIGTPGAEIRIRLDQTGNPHIVFYDRTGKDLRYLIRAGGQWAALAVDTSGDVGIEPSFVLDGNDRAHISYTDGTMEGLKYAEGSGVTGVEDGSWMAASGRWMHVVPNPSRGGSLQLALSAASHLGNDLRLTVRDVSGREITRIPVQEAGSRVSWLAVDARGKPLPAGVYALDLVNDKGVVARTSAVIVR